MNCGGHGGDGHDTSTIATLLKGGFQLNKEPLLDWAHRTSQLKPRPSEQPWPIIARFHYYNDCADILWRARGSQLIATGDTSPFFLTILLKWPGQLSAKSGDSCVAWMGCATVSSIQPDWGSAIKVWKKTLFQQRMPRHTLRRWTLGDIFTQYIPVMPCFSSFSFQAMFVYI